MERRCMMRRTRRRALAWAPAAALAVVWGAAGWAQIPAGVRGPIDSVGYATAPGQLEALSSVWDSMIAAGLPAADRREDDAGGPLIGAVVPHDDYLYAGPFYATALRDVRAPLVVIVGVSHRARRIGLEGKLVFDDYDAWRGPYGDVPVSSLRRRVIELLPPEIVLVSRELHAAEHSIEGLIPFLQYPGYGGPPEREILPMLATRQSGESFDRVVEALAAALGTALEENGLALGTGAAIVVSADCVHYGDDQWGGRDYAPFGTGREGYELAVAQDIEIARSTLAGPLTGASIRLFRERIERDDLQWPYRVTWCGVYSIPIGLGVLERLAARSGNRAPRGRILGYGTSIEPGPVPAGGSGLGTTAVNTLRHWVGYVSVVYR